MIIYRFKSKEEYQEWLSHESHGTRDKAKKFAQQYGDDILPIILQADGYTPQGGEWAPAYIFIHPSGEELLKWVVD